MHFYVIVKDEVTDANMKVVYGFPMNVYSATASVDKLSSNDGAVALSTGLKIYIAPNDKPLDDYYGFYALRMIPFFKSTGKNEIVVMVNSERAVQCWSWGSYNGAGFATKHDDAWVTYFTGKYFALMQYKGLNMIVCKLGKTGGTASTGDVIIVPATQLEPVGTNINNPLPKSDSTDPLLASSWNSLVTASSSGTKNFAILAGSDEYLGTMTTISKADTKIADISQASNLEGKTDAVSLPNDITLNDNGSSRLFDILPKANPTTTWLIGAAKLDALLQFKQAAKVDWTKARSVMTLCGPTVGSTIPSDLVITAGNTGSGHACTKAHTYTVGEVNEFVITGYDTRKTRYCRWCDAPAASGNNELYLKDFVPPTTSNRKLKGISVWAAMEDGAFNLATDTCETKTLQESVDIAASGCGAASVTKLDTKGQKVEFTMKSPVALAAEQEVVWEDSTGALAFNIGSLAAGSVSCTCGTTTWATTLTKESSGKRLRLTLPQKVSTATTEVVCDKGDLKCVAREWSTTATVVADMTATCFACQKGSGACTKEDSAKTVANSGLGVVRYKSDVTFKV